MQANKKSRYAPGLTLIQVMFLLAALGIALYVVLYFVKKDPAPAVTFNTISGEQVASESLRGKVVLVNFWATSCGSCVKEMPEMVQTYQKYKDRGLEFVAVAMEYDQPNYVRNYAQTQQLPFKVALDTDGSVAKSFGNVTLTPTTFLIDQDGLIIKRYVGIPEFSALHQLLEDALPA